MICIAIVSVLGFLLHDGFKVNDELRIPGLMRLLNPNDGMWKNAGYTDDLENETVQLQGPIGDIRIYYDDRLVPHIFADNDMDALFAQGYIEAKHRLWQMDFMSRLASGRLSEVLGEKTLQRDIMMRKYALDYGAEIAIKKWKEFPNQIKKISNYNNGVNAFINQIENGNAPLPVEFKLANYTPQEWKEIDGALISKYMAFTLCRSHNDIGLTNVKNLLGEEIYKELYPERNPKQVPVAAEDVSEYFPQLSRSKPIDVDYTEKALKGLSTNNAFRGIGSNNWAISSNKSKTGNPILANDPHLQLSLPSIWYELHIVTPTINAHGVSIPGVPGVIIGFNEEIAWGSTNVGQDVLDLYTIDWVNEEKTKYELDGQIKEVKVIPKTIKVKRQADYNYNMKITDFGPIMYETDDPETPDLAVQWIVHQSPDYSEANIFFEAMQCKDYDCFSAATKQFHSPAQNLIFADRDGDIGIRISGNLPIKYEGEGRLVKKGNSLKNKWINFIPRDGNPQTLNPARGFVSSANQTSASADYPYYYNGRFEHYRGRRINDLLSNSISKLDKENMFDFQLDAYSIRASELLPLLTKEVEKKYLSDEGKTILNELMTWDYNYDSESKGPSYFESWIDHFKVLVWDEMNVDPEIPMNEPKDWVLTLLMQNDRTHPIFDIKKTETIENLPELVNMAFINMMNEMKDKNDHTWGSINGVQINHLINIPGFSKQELKVNGCADALNATRGGFGPSWRMVVELGEKPKAYGVYPGGQSGNPLSPYYDNMIEDWANGNYNEIELIKDESHFKNNNLFTETLTSTNE